MKLLQSFCLLLTLVLLGGACTKKDQASVDQVNTGQSLDKATHLLDQAVDQFVDLAKVGELDPSQLKFLLNQFNNETDEFKKFMICSRIGFGMSSQKIKSLRPSKKSQPQYVEETKVATNYCRQATNRIAQYERSLTEEEWAKISNGVTGSNLVKTQRFIARPKECSEADIRKVIDTNKRAFQKARTIFYLSAFIEASEQEHFDKYFSDYRSVVLAKTSPDQKFILNYLDYYKEIRRSTNTTKRNREMSVSNRERLLKEGVTDIQGSIETALKLAPHCFSAVSLSTTENSRVVFNKKNMIKIRAYFSRKNKKAMESYLEPSKKMDGWLELVSTRRDELDKAGIEYRDTYGMPYYFRIQSNGLQVYSLGKDRKEKTADDVLI